MPLKSYVLSSVLSALTTITQKNKIIQFALLMTLLGKNILLLLISRQAVRSSEHGSKNNKGRTYEEMM